MKVSQKASDLSAQVALTCERPTQGPSADTENVMKNTTKRTLALRAHNIRNLTAAELRAAHGGVWAPLPEPLVPPNHSDPHAPVTR